MARLILLYYIAGVISRNWLDHHRAFVIHSGDLSSDAYYVIDAVGEKIEDEDMKSKIGREISNVIKEPDACMDCPCGKSAFKAAGKASQNM